MLKDVVEVRPLQGHRLHLRFEDGIEGSVDIKRFIHFRGVFKPLEDPAYFTKVSVNPEWGTVFWPNGADLDPDLLYSVVSGEPLPEFESASVDKHDG